MACKVAVRPFLNAPETELAGVPLIGKALVTVEIDHGSTVTDAAAEIDAQLLDNLAVHFRDRVFFASRNLPSDFSRLTGPWPGFSPTLGAVRKAARL